MFGVTTPCVQALTAALEGDYDCLVFHATGIGGRSMENLADSGMLAGAIDLTTTEVADLLVGGVFPADRGPLRRLHPHRPALCRLGRRARHGQFRAARHGAGEIPQPRISCIHNPNVTLMRTTRDENRAIGDWIGERLNQMRRPGPLPAAGGRRFGLDAPGKPFHDPEADNALFEAIEKTIAQTGQRQVERGGGEHQRAVLRARWSSASDAFATPLHARNHAKASRIWVKVEVLEHRRRTGGRRWEGEIEWANLRPADPVADRSRDHRRDRGLSAALALPPLDQGDGFRPDRLRRREGRHQRRRLRHPGAARDHAGQHERHADRGEARPDARR